MDWGRFPRFPEKAYFTGIFSEYPGRFRLIIIL
jgi:hypothetical protein